MNEEHVEEHEGSNKYGNNYIQKSKGRQTRKASTACNGSPQLVTKPQLTTNKAVGYNCIQAFNAVATANTKPLEVVKRKPMYNPPFYFNPELDALTPEERANMIYRYHLTILKKYDEHQRKSIIPAEWGKPITCSKNKSFQDDLGSSDEEQLFTSRAGRLCKRKLYTELDLSDDTDEDVKKKKKILTLPGPSTSNFNEYGKLEEIKRKKSLTPSSPGTSNFKKHGKLEEIEQKKSSIPSSPCTSNSKKYGKLEEIEQKKTSMSPSSSISDAEKHAELAKKYVNCLKTLSRSSKIMEKIDEI